MKGGSLLPLTLSLALAQVFPAHLAQRSAAASCPMPLLLRIGPAHSSRFISNEGESEAPHSGAISVLHDEWSLCHSVKMNISLR